MRRTDLGADVDAHGLPTVGAVEVEGGEGLQGPAPHAAHVHRLPLHLAQEREGAAVILVRKGRRGRGGEERGSQHTGRLRAEGA